MINALNLVTKLQNRPWVDKDITETLEKLFKYFDQNYHEFSSFEKWKKQVAKNQLSWSPVHTEKFWQAAFVYFNESDNLELIKQEINFLRTQSDGVNQMDLDTRKAVACFDLGEFARYFPQGRHFLEVNGAKEQLARIMSDNKAQPDLKKEAITAY